MSYAQTHTLARTQTHALTKPLLHLPSPRPQMENDSMNTQDRQTFIVWNVWGSWQRDSQDAVRQGNSKHDVNTHVRVCFGRPKGYTNIIC